MKKRIMKNRVRGLCAMICAGMLLLMGCAGTEMKTGADAASERETSTETEPITQDASKVEPAADQEQNTFTDGNDMINSAGLAGLTSGCSDTGCMINTNAFASVDEDGNSSSGDGGSIDEKNINVIYTDDTVFEKGTVKSDGSGAYSLEDSEKSDLKENDYVLCFGNQQADDTYLADRIIVITFN